MTPYEEGGVTGRNYKDELAKALQGTQAPGFQPGQSLPLDPKSVPIGDDLPSAGPTAPPTLNNQFSNQLEGFDQAKMGKNDPKYVFAKYAQGLNVGDANDRGKLQDLLRNDASGFFKNATLDGDILHGSFDPETGRYGDVDVIRGLKAGGQGWQWGAIPFDQPQQRSPFGKSTISPMLQSNAQANIQQALSQLQRPGFLQALIASLGQ